MISDKLQPHHLERKAVLYVRQSSAHQVLHNRESSALQYAMPPNIESELLFPRIVSGEVAKNALL